MDADLTNKVQDLLVGLLKQDGLVLFDLKITPRSGGVLIRILVDRPQGGITVEQCAGLNRSLTRLLEQEQLCPQGFELELSSPGADRPLKTSRDFQRVRGRCLQVQLVEAVDGQRDLKGDLKDVTEGGIVLCVAGRDIPIRLANVQKAIEFI